MGRPTQLPPNIARIFGAFQIFKYLISSTVP
jgi:hypothetical protein